MPVTSRPVFSDLDIALFVTVVEQNGIQAAASTLGLPRSTLSKRITRLENQLGVRLLNRNARRLSLTTIGQIYYEHGKRAVGCLEEAESAVQALRSEPSGSLTVTSAVMIGINAIIPQLPRFHEAYPNVRLELNLSDRFEDLVGSGYDVAIRFGKLSDSSLVARKITSAKRMICASPAYLEAHGAPETPEDLRNHNCLNLTTLGRTSNVWFFSRHGNVEGLEVSGNFATDSGAGHYAAILAGVGIGRVTHLKALHDMENGRLIRVLQDYELADATPVYAVMPSTKNMMPAARAFVEFISEIDL